ncbi:MAG: DUF1800 family protein [Saprospiraceae bacterium]|nr:DUF1800 family protein [Saprospiraceae bacterium]
MGMLKLYSGPFEKSEVLHLLRRTMFGVSKADLNFFMSKTLSESLDILINTKPTTPNPPLRTYYNNTDPTKDTFDKINNNGTIETIVNWGETWVDKPVQTNFLASSNSARRLNLKQWWTGLQIHQDRSVYEKMIMFYQTLLVTEDATLENAHMMYATQSLYRKYAFGNYKQLVKDITFDPGMLRYLNGEKNTKAAPDENFARELQELFCVGKGIGSGYTEEDVKSAARVLTGWYVIERGNVNGVQMNNLPKKAFNKNNHDNGVKTFSPFYNNLTISPDRSITDPTPFDTIEEKLAFLEIDQMIEMFFATDEVSKYVCRRLWNYFGYYDITPEIEAELIEPLAEIFRQYVNDPDQMRYVLYALFSSEVFFKNEHKGCMVKSPTDFTVGMIRQLDYPTPKSLQLEAQYYFWNIIRTHIFNQGQDINDPPNVAGWPAYYQSPSFHEIWIDTSTYPIRLGSISAISRSNFALPKTNTYDGANSPSYGYITKMDYINFIKKFDQPSDPNELINEITELLLGPLLSQNVRDNLKTTYLLLGQKNDFYWTEAWEEFIADPNTTDPVSRKVPSMLQDLVQYLMSSAEFQLC